MEIKYLLGGIVIGILITMLFVKIVTDFCKFNNRHIYHCGYRSQGKTLYNKRYNPTYKRPSTYGQVKYKPNKYGEIKYRNGGINYGNFN